MFGTIRLTIKDAFHRAEWPSRTKISTCKGTWKTISGLNWIRHWTLSRAKWFRL